MVEMDMIMLIVNMVDRDMIIRADNQCGGNGYGQADSQYGRYGYDNQADYQYSGNGCDHWADVQYGGCGSDRANNVGCGINRPISSNQRHYFYGNGSYTNGKYSWENHQNNTDTQQPKTDQFIGRGGKNFYNAAVNIVLVYLIMLVLQGCTASYLYLDDTSISLCSYSRMKIFNQL